MKIQYFFILIFASLFFSCQSKETKPKETIKTEKQQTGIVQKTYKLDQFKQSCCIKIVDYSLKKIDGLEKIEADVKNQTLSVWYDSSKCDEAKIQEAINKTPYKIVK
ncbi:heavy-metal-associated domain-containing protein [Aureivirga sp. CE67]|uniref:heavy-metal-associated domain-containing protein n=1 Tax=Aureivirga sp. CE67 TaxID=1788983 RepID=UPI0018CB9E6A|nr:heavy-metal-associated domain-containing protein [Aureivirga sp. CE67]